MEKLFKLAWKRFKERFLRYYLVSLLGWGILLVSILGMVMLGGVFYVLFLLLGKSLIIGGSLVMVWVISFLLLIGYIDGWVKLANVSAIRDGGANSVMGCFGETKGIIIGFLVFEILQALFLTGIFYTNILLLIPAILWSVWGAFSIFAYVEGKRGGLTPLWYSRARVKKSFMRVFISLVVLFLAILMVYFILFRISGKMAFLNGAISFLLGPFITAYVYELYKSLPEADEYKVPSVWVILSIIGWIIIVLVFVVLGNAMKEKLLQEEMMLKRRRLPRYYIQKNFNRTHPQPLKPKTFRRINRL